MATYPLTYISRTSAAKPDAGIRADVAADGVIKYQKRRSTTAFALTIVHEWITEADLAALESFISSNGYGPHSFTLRGVTYTITLINDPEVIEHKGGLLMVQIPALGIKA